jgi:hypothetical protein
MSAATARLVSAMDYLRRPAEPLPGLSGHKEWHHFLVEVPGLLVLVNFSLSEEHSEEHTRHRERTVGRLKVLVRSGGAWDGDIDVYEADDLRAHAGAVDVTFGAQAIRFDGTRYHVNVALREEDVAIDLELVPTAAPLLVQHVRLAPGKPLSWVMVPRLAASGTVRHRGLTHTLRDAPAYHDHNWGYFGWGDDFTWEWGTALPRADQRWSVAMVRTTDRGRTRQGLAALYLWRGPRLARILRGDELEIAHAGLLRPKRIFKVPRVMAMLEDGAAVDVPARVLVRGRAPGANVEVAVDVVDLAQILMPDEDARASVTTLNQAYGRISMRGTVDGEDVSMEAGGVFEFIRATSSPRAPAHCAATVEVDAPDDTGRGPMLPIVIDSFRALARERPHALAAMCARLSGRALDIVVDGEPIAVRFEPARVRLAPSDERADVRIELRRQLIADIIRAEVTLGDALVAGRLEARGSTRDLALVHESLMDYVHGAIRAPSFPALWDRFRSLPTTEAP